MNSFNPGLTVSQQYHLPAHFPRELSSYFSMEPSIAEEVQKPATIPTGSLAHVSPVSNLASSSSATALSFDFDHQRSSFATAPLNQASSSSALAFNPSPIHAEPTVTSDEIVTASPRVSEVPAPEPEPALLKLTKLTKLTKITKPSRSKSNLAHKLYSSSSAEADCIVCYDPEMDEDEGAGEVVICDGCNFVAILRLPPPQIFQRHFLCPGLSSRLLRHHVRSRRRLVLPPV